MGVTPSLVTACFSKRGLIKIGLYYHYDNNSQVFSIDNVKTPTKSQG